MKTFFLLSLFLVSHVLAQYSHSTERVPSFPKEFRAAWIACVYNIDWPSKKGLPARVQKQELDRILNRAAALKLNAIIFQVRPNADAVYSSRLEPWSHWISGKMGKSPGYDPLAYCIAAAHARGIEVHAWFNPFRALPNRSMPASASHVSRRYRSWCKAFRSYLWLNPSNRAAQRHSLNVMLDVVKRYDIDGLHIDDYFYPYPKVLAGGRQERRFPDGLSDAQRRAHIDYFVRNMYQSVKKIKPHVRVGISPFGIWKPGVPSSIEAGLNAYSHIAADSRKWLNRGWCDYLAPQLYWRDYPKKQSFSTLLTWWQKQGLRPVWPGIATTRILSKEDPGRRSGEITKQVNLSRRITGGKRGQAGHIHWSMKSLMQNRDGVTSKLSKKEYRSPALVPAMPWISRTPPATPKTSASTSGANTKVYWQAVPTARRYAIQARYGKHWYAMHVASAASRSATLKGKPDAIAVTAVNAFGTTSAPSVLKR